MNKKWIKIYVCKDYELTEYTYKTEKSIKSGLDVSAWIDKPILYITKKQLKFIEKAETAYYKAQKILENAYPEED